MLEKRKMAANNIHRVQGERRTFCKRPPQKGLGRNFFSQILVHSILSSRWIFIFVILLCIKNVFVQYVLNAMSSKWTLRKYRIVVYTSRFGYQSDTRFKIRNLIFFFFLLLFFNTQAVRLGGKALTMIFPPFSSLSFFGVNHCLCREPRASISDMSQTGRTLTIIMKG